MSAKSHHEFHPDAESLNAFAEQALGKRERAEMLAHLAACSRCRHVVALACEAAGGIADAEPVKAANGHAPRAWWKSWWLISAPVAALAALAALAVYVHVRNSERSADELVLVEPRSEAPNGEAVPAPAKEAPAKVPEPATPAPEKPAAKPMHVTPSNESHSGPEQKATEATRALPETGNQPEGRAYSDAEEGPERKRSSAPEAAQRAPEGVHGLAFSYEQHAAPPAPVPLPPAGGDEIRNEEMHEDYKARQPADAVVEQEQAEQKQEAAQAKKRAFAARAAAPGLAGGSVPSATESVSVSPEASLQIQPAPLPESVAAPEAEIARSTANAGETIHLPNGLEAASIAAAGRRMLAIDNAGALFLSDDRGKNWERVTPQWTGRAVEVRRRGAINGALRLGPAAQAAPADQNADKTAPAQPPTIFFELLNDKDQIWLSTDGRIWIAQ
jgi:hypothetical protein